MEQLITVAQRDCKFICSLNVNGSFGELALISDGERAATIMCEKECYFGVLSKESYKYAVHRMNN